MGSSGGEHFDFEFDRIDAEFCSDVDAPDLSDRILTSVDRKRAFLPAALRRTVSVGRFAIGGAVALVALGGAALYNINPELATLGSHEAPLTRVVQEAGDEFRAGLSGTASFDPINATVSLTRHALPSYIPDSQQFAQAAATEGLMTIGAPEQCEQSMRRCPGSASYVLSVSRDLPCDSSSTPCARAILLMSSSITVDDTLVATDDRVAPQRGSGSYIP